MSPDGARIQGAILRLVIYKKPFSRKSARLARRDHSGGFISDPVIPDPGFRPVQIPCQPNRVRGFEASSDSRALGRFVAQDMMGPLFDVAISIEA